MTDETPIEPTDVVPAPAPLAERPAVDLAAVRTLADLGIEEYGGSMLSLNGKRILISEVGIFTSRRYDSGAYLIAAVWEPSTGEIGPWQRYSSFALPVKRIVARLMYGQELSYRELNPPLACQVSTAGETYELV